MRDRTTLPRLPRLVFQQLGCQDFGHSELQISGVALAQTQSQLLVLEKPNSTGLRPCERFQDLHIRHSDLKYNEMIKISQQLFSPFDKMLLSSSVHNSYIKISCLLSVSKIE